MKPSMLKLAIKELYCNTDRRALCIEGPPGIGKTSIVGQTAQDMDLHYIEKHLPTMLVEDFGALDLFGDKPTFGYKLPDWYPAKGSKWDDGRGGILCFDDRNSTDQTIQKVLANIIQARTLHGVPLADKWMVISTGNRVSDRAGAIRVLGHLRNREDVVEMTMTVEDWTDYALKTGVHPAVVSFVQARPALLHKYDPLAEDEIQPTCRSWVEGVSWKMGKVDSRLHEELFSGAVGRGAAAEFLGFLKIRDELDPAEIIISNPDKARVPTKVDMLWAVVGMLAEYATPTNFGAVITYLERLPREYSVLGVTSAGKRNKALTETEAFVKWSIKNQSALF